MPILTDLAGTRPDVVLMLGDNVYANASSVRELRRAYQQLQGSSRYARLAKQVAILATWDDHDYGRNDVGKEYELKAESKATMLDFYGEPVDSPRRARAGNYASRIVGPVGKRVQIVLLDTRWFRDQLTIGRPPPAKYVPNHDPKASLLGAAQWQWLKQQVQLEAELRIIVTSIQAVAAEHGFESWGLFPSERAQLFAVLGQANGGPAVLLSGDRHRGELSCVASPAVGYPLFELTSSSLNRPGTGGEDNRFRRPGMRLVGEENFGLLEVDWVRQSLTFQLRTLGGAIALEETVPLSALGKHAGVDGVPNCAPV